MSDIVFAVAMTHIGGATRIVAEVDADTMIELLNDPDWGWFRAERLGDPRKPAYIPGGDE